MKIHGKEYRIVETVYEDGHKEYRAQEAKRFLFIKYWEDYMICATDSFLCIIRYRCSGLTYDDCLEHLKNDIEKRIRWKQQTTVKAVNKYI